MAQQEIQISRSRTFQYYYTYCYCYLICFMFRPLWVWEHGCTRYYPIWTDIAQPPHITIPKACYCCPHYNVLGRYTQSHHNVGTWTGVGLTTYTVLCTRSTMVHNTSHDFHL